LRDKGTLLGGEEKVDGEIKLFIGAAENPFGDPFEFRVIRLAKKVRAGADFRSDPGYIRRQPVQRIHEDGLR
jgi:methylenetetrahydrofolate reductase (NADPH)